MRVVHGLTELEQLTGTTVGTSGWMTVTQEMVNTFSDVTGDHQWIHLDVERATRELPVGGPIVQGFFTLSLVIKFRTEILDVRGVTRTINYGLNRVRFIAPVVVGTRLRGTETILSAERTAPHSLRLTSSCVISAEGLSKPVCSAEIVTLLYE